MDFLGVFIIVVCTVVFFKFISFCIRAKTVSYQDWTANSKRLQLLETVRTVREEQGDYVRASNSNHIHRPTRRPTTKKASSKVRSQEGRIADARPAARRRK